MFEKIYIQAALNKALAQDPRKGRALKNIEHHQDSSITSLLVYDIFGGEILKTHQENDWYFYNRINGERIDFSKAVNNKSAKAKSFDDLPVTPDETYNYFEQEDYSTFFMRFINAFEETVGLKKYQTGYVE